MRQSPWPAGTWLRGAFLLTCAALALHITAVATRGLAEHRVPWVNMYEFSAAFTCSAVLMFVLGAVRFRAYYLGLFVLLPVVLAVGWWFSAEGSDAHRAKVPVPVFAIMASPSLLSSLGIFAESPKEPSIPVPGTKHTVITPQDPIGRNNEDVIGPAERRGPHNMKVLTEASGGAVFTARRLSDLPRIVRAIGSAIRYAYLIGYQPPARVERVSGSSNPSAVGWHRVKVTLVPASRYGGYVVYAKDGYYDDRIP